MAELINYTPFAATCVPAMDLRNEERALLIVAARFHLPAPGRTLDPLPLDEHAPPIPLTDSYYGEPGHSSLHWEGQFNCERPGTDIYVSGHAWASRGRPTHESLVAVELGPCRQTAIVLGDRTWHSGITGLAPSATAPFERVPLIYERCFGGLIEGAEAARSRYALAIDRNPIGVGLVARAGAPLPNLEDPHTRISSTRDRPSPRGFGPVGRHWLPRRSLAGSYDEDWIRTRAPLWPDDVDPRFFMAAPVPLQTPAHLQGTEPLSVVGMHPDGAIHCTLPQHKLRARFEHGRTETRRRLTLDAVMIEPDELALTLIWRASVPVKPNILALARVVVRELERWEEDG